MISFLRGTYMGSEGDKALIEVNGVGFAVGMSARSLARMPEKGRSVLVYTVMQVREDSMSLFGFLSEQERTLFNQLTGVSGIGAKIALAALATYEPSDLANAILNEDTVAVSHIPGVGKKTASRIILELKGSLEKTGTATVLAEIAPRASGVSEALLSMGFTAQEVKTALMGAPEGASEGALLQYALKHMGS